MKAIAVFIGSPRKRGTKYVGTRRFLDNLESLGDVKGEIVMFRTKEAAGRAGAQTRLPDRRVQNPALLPVPK
jgi:hypothetical protein